MKIAAIILFVLGTQLVHAEAQMDWSLEGAYSNKTETREKISLNGLWKISLDLGDDLFVTKKLTKKEQIIQALSGQKKKVVIPKTNYNTEREWRDMRVPGLWYDSGWWSATVYECMLDPNQKEPFVRNCNRQKWNSIPLKDYYYAWYSREFNLPESWAAGEAKLRLDKINREGWVFANGIYIGHTMTNQAKVLDIPSTIKPGERVKLNILIGSAVSGNERVFMGGEQITTRKKKVEFRGISGDAWLLRRPENIVQKVVIIPSVRNKNLKLQVDLSGSAAGELEIAISDSKTNETVKSTTLKIENGKELTKGCYEFSIPWENPTLWNPDNPFLYNMELTWKDIDGDIIDQAYPERFGFRECWIVGRDYFINGNPVRFRIKSIAPMPKKIALARIKHLQEIGYNTIEVNGHQRISENHPLKGILEAADETGMMIMLALPPVNQLRTTWTSELVRDKWLRSAKAFVDVSMNSPSVVQWSMNFNLLGYAFDLYPHAIGSDYYPTKTSGPGVKWEVAEQSEKMVLQLDSSRPIFHHAGGNYGQAHTSNIYLNFSPVSEKSDWLLPWSQNGKKPFIAIELGTPYEANYYHNKTSVALKENYKSEPLYAEYSARMLGPKAYSLAKTERIRRIMDMKVKPGALSEGSDKYMKMEGYFYGPYRAEALDDFMQSQTILGDFVKDWRAYGLCGFSPFNNSYAKYVNLKFYNGKKAKYKSLKTPGYKPVFDYTPSWDKKTVLYDKYKEWLEASLFYIGGPKNSFTDKQHTYSPAGKITKSVVWVNDKLTNQSSEVLFELKDNDGNTIGTKNFTMKATPGQIQFEEVQFDVPNTEKRIACSINLTVDGMLKDKLEIQVLPEVKEFEANMNRTVHLFDTKGYTQKLLDDAKVKYTPYEAGNLTPNSLLIIGRESLKGFIGQIDGVKKFIKNGTNLIIFEQQGKILEKVFGLRTFNASSRRVFAGESKTPILADIKPEDLIDWPGKATLLEEYPDAPENKYPKHIWKFGNRQMVASVVIEKPHYGRFRSLLSEGFDLAYSPLLEENVGNGKILFNQLDLSGRTTKNPVGDIMLKNIISYMDNANAATTNLYYIGGENGREIMNLTGVNYQDITSLTNIPVTGTLVLGSSKYISPRKLEIMRRLNLPTPKNLLLQSSKELQSFVQNGGKLVILAATDLDKVSAALNLNLEKFTMDKFRLDDKPVSNLTTGLTAGDWYWKDNLSLNLPAKDFALKKIDSGKGDVLICQINPLYFNKEQMIQRRARSQAKMTRVLSTILNNIGAEFKSNSLDRIKKINLIDDIDLTGKWDFAIDPDNKGLDKNWNQQASDNVKKMSVPGEWEEQGENTPNPNMDGKLPYDGYAWYWKKVMIPKELEAKQLYLEIGAVDDYDWCYFNGLEIGHTGKDTPKFWATRRRYSIPKDNIKYGEENLIAVRVCDTFMGGGIVKSPVKITFDRKRELPYLDADKKDHQRFDPYLFHRW